MITQTTTYKCDYCDAEKAPGKLPDHSWRILQAINPEWLGKEGEK